MSTPVEPGATELRTPVDGRPSVGELFSDVAADLSTLMRQEIDLAKAEVRQSATKAGKGAGLLAGAGISGHLVLIFVSVAAWWGLGESIGHGWSALVVAAIWLIIAAVLGLAGRREMSAVSGLPQTAQTVKKIPAAAKGNEGMS
ncbi:MAG TPA: phage holin family protein [Streptosporangiaceae bacterium]